MQFSLVPVLWATLLGSSAAFTGIASKPLAASQCRQFQLRTGPVLKASAEEQSQADDEIEKLKTMAAKLRAEAMALEADRAKELAEAAERAFQKFDTNQDGEISLEELKAGLEKAFKMELPEKRVQQLMNDFDTNQDGALQLNEFVGVDKFRNALEQLAREEKMAAQEAQKAAKVESEMAKFLEEQMELINDRDPSTSEKVISTLPYLFPLMDGLQFGRFLLVENADNPLVAIVAILFALYKSVPFSGFIAFIALNLLSSNPSINKLIRFNMQQAIFLDIFLFFPGLLGALYILVAQNMAGISVPPAVTEIGSDAVFFSLLVAIGYATVSSLLGKEPDQIPIISKLVQDRMPRFEVDMSQFGQVQPRKEETPGDDDKKDKKD
ncbi:Protein TIC 20 [Seminavis robusta]|uniref:Protein TIC 20 n=1 Tax=Seminavis robusta TaxID=568900 RepID=A0A9N8DJY2_9STRA|nr:Protein TIC 20 [Seminavis robusta]|eukprot:Sro127_g060710.1 Protein TIC 20 (382) ;mRNA; r:10712-11857